MKHILFLCAGNTCRSPMAAGIFNAIVAQKGGDFEAESAGLYAVKGQPAAENAVEACREIGVELGGHASRSFDLSMLQSDWSAVPLTHDYAAALLAAGVPRDRLWIPEQPVSDPFGGDLECYRRCRVQLEGLCAALYEELERRG